MYLSSGMGITRLTWSELEAFCNTSGYPLDNWEKEAILEMSGSYCHSYYSSAKLGAPPPFSAAARDDEDALAAMRAKVARQWGSFEKGFSKNPTKKKAGR